VSIHYSESEAHVIDYLKIKPKDFGPKFQQGRPNIVKVLNSINPEKQDRDKVLKDLEAVGRAVLGLYIALSRVEDGPEWRQEAGL
jgi:hypothetical protein